MKQLITKSDGTPMKSKLHAVQFLQKKGIDKELLIEENGQFFYEEVNEAEPQEVEFKHAKSLIETLEEGKTLKQVQGDSTEEAKEVDCHVADAPRNDEVCLLPVNWKTPVYDKNNQKTVLIIPGTDIKATINAKHPGGQIRPTSAFEIAIGQENFIMSLDLVSKLFKIKEAK